MSLPSDLNTQINCKPLSSPHSTLCPSITELLMHQYVFSAGYVAGVVDPEVSNRSDLFDVYVNLPDSVITVSQSARGTVCSKRKQYSL